jgi:hypothetical protein
MKQIIFLSIIGLYSWCVRGQTVVAHTSLSELNTSSQIIGGIGIQTFDNYYDIKKNIIKNSSDDSRNIFMSNEIEIIIYPNPATNYVWIELTNKLENNKSIIEIYNSVGSKVKCYNNSFNTKSIIDISDLSDGIYAIRIKYHNEIINQKIIKQTN